MCSKHGSRPEQGGCHPIQPCVWQLHSPIILHLHVFSTAMSMATPKSTLGSWSNHLWKRYFAHLPVKDSRREHGTYSSALSFSSRAGWPSPYSRGPHPVHPPTRPPNRPGHVTSPPQPPLRLVPFVTNMFLECQQQLQHQNATTGS